MVDTKSGRSSGLYFVISRLNLQSKGGRGEGGMEGERKGGSKEVEEIEKEGGRKEGKEKREGGGEKGWEWKVGRQGGRSEERD